MASINPSKSAASSRLLGFKNDPSQPLTGSVAISSTSVAAGTFTKHSFQITLPRTNAVSSWQAQLTGLESEWRDVTGSFQANKPDSGTITNSIMVEGYYSGATFYIDVYFINQTGGAITRPAFTVNARLFTFVAPF